MEAFQFCLPSPPCRPHAARNWPTHSLSLSPPPRWVGLGGAGSCSFNPTTPVQKLRVVKVTVITRLAGERSRHLEPQRSGAAKREKRADKHDPKAVIDVLMKATIFP